MTGLAEDDLTDEIGRALEARLLVDRSSPLEDRFAFADDQIQQVLYDRIVVVSPKVRTLFP